MGEIKKIILSAMLVFGLMFAGASGVSAADSSSLQAIIDAAESGSTITLEDDYTGQVTIRDKDLVIDLNGHAITNSGTTTIKFAHGTFTIKDSKGGGKIEQTGKSNAITLNGVEASYNENETKATVTLKSGSIVSTGFGVSIFNDSKFVMDGGSVVSTGDEYYAITSNGTQETSRDTYGRNAEIVINGGTVTSNDYAIYGGSFGGTVYSITINGGTITGNAGAVGMNAGVLNVNGGTLISNGTDTNIVTSVAASDGLDWATNAVIATPGRYALVTVNITDGKLIAKGDAEVISNAIVSNDANADFITNAKANQNVIISGGTFEGGEVDSSFIDPSYELVKNSDGTYSVKTKANDNTKSEEKTDTNTVTNPETMDNIVIYGIVSLISLCSLVFALYRRRLN